MPTLKEQKEINLVGKLLNSKKRNKNILVRKLLISKKFKEPNTHGKCECKNIIE
jgi:hypothetical protein